MCIDEQALLLVDSIQGRLSRIFRTSRLFRGGQYGLLMVACSFFLTTNAYAESTYDLSTRPEVGNLQQVQAVLEVQGELSLNADGSEVRRLPLVVRGRVLYHERLLEAGSEDVPWAARSVRHYIEAAADIEIGKGKLAPKLDSGCRMIVAQVGKQGVSLVSPLGPMNREDLDLIDIQGNSLLLSSVLPTTPVQVGQSWQIENEPLALLVGLEVVTQSDVSCSLDKVEDQVAVIVIQGTAHGAIGGVASEITLKAKCNYDLDSHQVTWLAASLKEKRAIGHAEPGLDVTARLRVAVKPLEQSEHLGDKQLRDLALDPHSGARLLVFKSRRGSFRFVHDRRWRSMVDRHNLTVFRFVDSGDLVAQCNVSELTDVESGKHMALESFQQEVQRSLGDNFGQIVEASQFDTEDGTRVLRVQASGSASEIPVIWIYYHVSNGQGRRAALAFTLEADLLERFAESDKTMVETFEFAPRPQPSEAQRQTPATTERR